MQSPELDDGTATAGQYDPAQGATNTRRMVADPTCVVALGPMSSTPGKAMSPIFREGDLATITPTSTNRDITDPKFAGVYRPRGKAICFRTAARPDGRAQFLFGGGCDSLIAVLWRRQVHTTLEVAPVPACARNFFAVPAPAGARGLVCTHCSWA